MKKAKPRTTSKSNASKGMTIEHLHNEKQYAQAQPRPILKVKSTAEAYQEQNKGDDVLLSQDAMKEILGQLKELQELKKAFAELKEENEQQRAKDKSTKNTSIQKQRLDNTNSVESISEEAKFSKSTSQEHLKSKQHRNPMTKNTKNVQIQDTKQNQPNNSSKKAKNLQKSSSK